MADNLFTSSSTGTASTTPTTETFNLSGLKDSTDWTVDPKTQTVSGQLESVISSNSPLIQQARARALQSMNSRGLTNSSMATGAADSAMYDAAMPIAQGNAAVYSDAAKTNAAQKNQFGMAANNQAYDLQKMGAQQDYNLQTMGVQQQNELTKMQTQQGYNMQTLQAQYGFDLGKMDKQAALTLQQMSADQQNQLARMATQQGFNMQTLNAQQVNDLQKLAVQQQNNLQTLSTQYGFDMAKMDAQVKNTLTTMTADQQNRMMTMAAQNGYDISKMNLQQTLDLAKLDKQTAAAIQVADIEAAYKNLTQGSASATSILNKMQDSLNLLAANKDITDPAVRDQMTADIKANAVDSLSLIGAIAGDVDLTPYLTAIG